jgi:hypothetical protein
MTVLISERQSNESQPCTRSANDILKFTGCKLTSELIITTNISDEYQDILRTSLAINKSLIVETNYYTCITTAEDKVTSKFYFPLSLLLCPIP